MNATDWAAEVSAWRKSGRTAAEYSRERGLKLTRLRYWSCKFKRSDSEPLSRAVAEAAGSRLARVGRRSASTPITESAPGEPAALRLMVGQVSVEVPQNFDTKTLGRLLDVLGGGGR